MKGEKSSVLGHLVEVTPAYFVASLISDLEGLTTEKMIGMDKVRIGQIGSYVIVEQSETKILCMVESIWTETSPNDVDEYRVRVSPLGEFNSSGNFDRGIHEVLTENGRPDDRKQNAHENRTAHPGCCPNRWVYVHDPDFGDRDANYRHQKHGEKRPGEHTKKLLQDHPAACG